MMVGITEAMLKRRAEHNDGVLYTLEELVLQEEGLDKIDKILGTLCPHLKHLYMPNNLIPRIGSFVFSTFDYLAILMPDFSIKRLALCLAIEQSLISAICHLIGLIK
ncbi:hypothetical protein GOP47_0018487 [Adiantum capillus-veneris]|uniref:Uncharacterized protein n=1 Tax=Adiantum capillus-veneris TaxID=13818 RepID=A0A9D4UD76_ADICA|nr:hypothetical protein GOP47_0018487 [Adiantum capillus-veneris]